MNAAVSAHARQPFHALVRRREREVQRPDAKRREVAGKFAHPRRIPGAGRNSLDEHVIPAVDMVERNVLVAQIPRGIEHRVSGWPGDRVGWIRAIIGELSKITQSMRSIATTPLASNRGRSEASVASRSGPWPRAGCATNSTPHRRAGGSPLPTVSCRREVERCEAGTARADGIAPAQFIELLAGAVVAHPDVVVDA